MNKTIVEKMMGDSFTEYFCSPEPNFDARQPDREPVEEKDAAVEEVRREVSAKHQLA
jgi:hypothetical protein